jgi:hypothetical protein
MLNKSACPHVTTASATHACACASFHCRCALSDASLLRAAADAAKTFLLGAKELTRVRAHAASCRGAPQPCADTRTPRSAHHVRVFRFPRSAPQLPLWDAGITVGPFNVPVTCFFRRHLERVRARMRALHARAMGAIGHAWPARG